MRWGASLRASWPLAMATTVLLALVAWFVPARGLIDEEEPNPEAEPNHPPQDEASQETLSAFDVFVKQFDRKVPEDALAWLAEKLCDETQPLGNADNGQPPPTTQTGDDRDDDQNDDTTICRVSWEGISPQWFTDVFLQIPEVQAFLEHGCRAWFLREYGIPALLRRRGIKSGPVVDHLARLVQTELAENMPRRHSGKATVFISFTGSYKLEHFVELLRHPELDGEYLWIDTFCVDQFAWNERKDDEMKSFKKQFMHDLGEKIGGINSTALLLDRWDHVMATLGKIWVLWEIFSTAKRNCKLRVLFRPHEYDRFVQEELLSDGESTVLKALSKIDANEATAFREEDKKLILSLMEENDGVGKVNTTMCNRMRQWMLEVGRVQLEQMDETHDKWSTLVQNMGLLHNSLGNLEDAEFLLNEALTSRRKILGDQHLKTLETITCLAGLFHDRGRFDKAEPLYQEAFIGFQCKLGPTHTATLASMNNLARLYHYSGQLTKAAPLYKEAVRLHRGVLGNKHHNTLVAIHNLAGFLLGEGKFAESEQFYREVVDGLRETLGKRHPDTLTCMDGMAVCLRAMRKLEDAEQLLREALKGRREIFGNEHMGTFSTVKNLALVLYEGGNVKEAKVLYKEALGSFREAEGDLHPATLSCMEDYANLLCSVGELDDAESLYRQAVLGNRLMGNKHPRTLSSMNQLARVLYFKRRFEEAEALYEEALRGRREVLGETHLDTLTTLNNLANLLFATERLDEAEPLYRQALRGYRDARGYDHPDARTTCDNLTQLLRVQGRLDEAARLHRTV